MILNKNLKLLACICKTLSKTLHITKSIAIQNKNGRTPTQIKYTQRQSKNVRPGRDCTRKHCQEIKRNVYLIDNIFLVSVWTDSILPVRLIYYQTLSFQSPYNFNGVAVLIDFFKCGLFFFKKFWFLKFKKNNGSIWLLK